MQLTQPNNTTHKQPATSQTNNQQTNHNNQNTKQNQKNVATLLNTAT